MIIYAVWGEGKHLNNVNIGSAYVSENNFFDLQVNEKTSWIKLNEFRYGRMIFDYYGDKENFLVVADAWHPFWKAKIDDEIIPVIKVNEIFKGVKLPPGQGDCGSLNPKTQGVVYNWLEYKF